MSVGTYRRAAATLVALGVIGGLAATPAYAAPSADPSGSTANGAPVGIAAAGECAFPSSNVVSAPWALQRVVLDQLWGDKKQYTGSSVTVAVIDTGVDDVNPQLAGKVIDGKSLLVDKSNRNAPVTGTGTTDTVGHGTKVAGIIAARASTLTGFVGLAPDAKILSIRQNDNQGNGDVDTLIQAIDQAVATSGVKVINISQDVRDAGSSGTFPKKTELSNAIDRAEKAGVVVVASAGNDGREGNTYPAAFDTVLSVGASDRNNERASFSEYGDFVKVAAPGVDMLSTVPKGGQCVDNGTSFSAPYVAGLAALLMDKYKDWTPQQVRTRIEQTAQRTDRGANKFIGWGVVDPVKAMNSPDPVGASPTPDARMKLDAAPIVAQPLGLAETQADRDRRTGTYVLGLAALLVAALAGGSIVVRDSRRRRSS